VLNVNQVIGTSSGGFIFNNTVGVAGGSPNPAVGSTANFVSVGSDLLTNYAFFGGGSTPASFTGQQIVKVIAVSGVTTVVAPGGLTNSVITNGGLAYYAIPTGTYNQFNPLTFGTAATLIAKFQIVSPQDIGQTSSGLCGGIPASAVNQIGLNTLSAVNAQGHFLLSESPGGLVGPGFITANTAGLPPGFVVTGEGLHVLINEQVALGSATGPLDPANQFRFVDPANPTGAAGLAALNAFAAALGANGGVFATGFGADAVNGNTFNPYAGPSVTGTSGSGDFGTLFGNTDFPGVFAAPPPGVPEPTTMAAFGLIAATTGLFGVRRRRSRTAA